MAEAHPPRVLMIDDDPSVREVVGSLLASFRYVCQTAADGRSGLVRFDEGGWDLVLTHLVMPEVGGWDVVKAMRRHAPTMPIVVLTAESDPTVMRRGASEGAGRLEAVSLADAQGRRGRGGVHKTS